MKKKKKKSLNLFVTCCCDVVLEDRHWLETRMNNKTLVFLTCERKTDFNEPTANVNLRLI